MSVEAMHIANGIVNGQVSAAFAVVALAALAFCVLRSRADLDDRLAPMAGLVAAFIFAVQMLNFQVLPGVSGGAVLVFLTVMKELPVTLILSPIGFDTLATRIWSATSEGFYTRAALPALILVALSSLPMLFSVMREEQRS